MGQDIDGKVSKLLQKPFKIFTVYALLVLLASIPVYYFIVDRIWLGELDEHNETIAQKIEKELNALQLNDNELDYSLKLWNKVQPGTNLVEIKDGVKKQDSIYIVLRPNPYDIKDINRYRCLSRSIHLNEKIYHLTVETNVEETEETIVAIAIITFFFFVLLVVGFLILNKRLSAQIWKPFQSTLNKLKAFNLNGLENIELEKSDIVEFEELNAVLNKLIEGNISAFRMQKEFTENASHELQTPLAIIRSKIDLLLQTESLTVDQYNIIEDINKVITKVSRINRNLLLLSKIENQQYSQKEEINISMVLHENLTSLQEYLEDKSIHLDVKVLDNVLLSGNKVLIEIMMNNLILNAIRHNYEHGTIEVELFENKLIISNSGKIALKEENLFRRFSGATTEKVGSGLGLAIVKEICNSYHWNIHYNFIDNTHQFTVTF
ncbi:sensor histidine kinase [Flavobacterium sp. '19STA2R22 D10 B1']|uniref:sensor histidine kinase n=1 Tax=Flavobacterium aerium TaxID=3037261 RepID=UPI00278C8B43|nr:HAMP domain-containing sensor histidine kinase [Flavobacterium sp. '19STA2R22 D10 B1']